MDKSLHDIDSLFKSALNNYEAMPSKKLWEDIESNLDNDKVNIIKKKYNNLKKFFLLLVIVLTGIGIYESNTLTQKNSTSVKKGLSGKENLVMVPNQIKNEDHKREEKKLNAANDPLLSKDDTEVPDKTGSKKETLNNGIAVTNRGGSISDKNESISPQRESKELLLKTGVIDANSNSLAAVEKNLMLPAQADLMETVHQTPVTIDQSLLSKNYLPSITVKNPPVSIAANSSRISLSVFYSHDFAWYRLKDNDAGNQPGNSNNIKRSERHEFSATEGLLIDYDLNEKWSLQSGLTFSQTEIAVDPSIIYAEPDNNGDVKYRINVSSGYGYLVPSFQPSPSVGDSVKVTATAHKLHYLGIPIAVKYSIIKGKLKIEAVGGLSANFLTRGKLETEIQKGVNSETDVLTKIEGLKSIYFSAMAGISAEYNLSGKYSFMLMPITKFALNSINKGGMVKTYPNSFGLAAGIKIRL